MHETTGCLEQMIRPWAEKASNNKEMAIPLNSIAVRLAVSRHQDSIIRTKACSPFPRPSSPCFLGSLSCPLFLAAVGDGIPTSKKERVSCWLSASELTLMCRGWHRRRALECCSCVALGESLNLPEPPFPPLYNNKVIPDELWSKGLILKS